MSVIKPIDGTALLKEFGGMNIDEYDYELYSEIFDMIEQAPKIDYAPVVHAHWEIIYPNELKQMQGNKCSSCGYEYYGNLHDYCSSCGAIMDEEEENG